MSIESNIAELTAAVKELTAAILAGQGKESCAGKCSSANVGDNVTVLQSDGNMTGGQLLRDASGTAVEEVQEANRAKKSAQTAKQEAASTQPTATAQETAPDAKAENSDKPLDYEKDVRPLFQKLVVKDRQKAIEFMQTYKPGCMKLYDAITPDQFGEVVAKINELLAG